jgi:hypothetical protein
VAPQFLALFFTAEKSSTALIETAGTNVLPEHPEGDEINSCAAHGLLRPIQQGSIDA